MLIKSSVYNLYNYVREGEECSCPFFLFEPDGIKLAIFTYFACQTSESSIMVYGFGQIIKTDGKNVISQEKEIFENEEECIFIDNIVMVEKEVHEKLYDDYYNELQKIYNNFSLLGLNQDTTNLSNIFNRIIHKEAKEIYNRICPSYLKFLSLSE